MTYDLEEPVVIRDVPELHDPDVDKIARADAIVERVMSSLSG